MVTKSVQDSDSLLMCLMHIAKLHNRSADPDALLANLPLSADERLTPASFIEAAKRIDLTAKLINVSFNRLAHEILPVVMLLKDGNAILLLEKTKDIVTVYDPKQGETTITLTHKEIENQYNGQIIAVKIEHPFESRIDTELLKPSRLNWFWRVIWRFKSIYIRVLIASLFINLFAIAMPLFIMNVYDRVVPTNAISTLWVLTLGIAIVIFFDFVFKTLRVFFIDKASEKVDILLSSELLNHSLNTEMLSQPASSGVQAGHIKEFEAVREFFTSATVASFIDLPFITIFILVIALIGGLLFWVPLIGVLFVIIATVLLSIPMSRAVKASFVGSAQKSALLYESLSSIETLKASNANATVLGRWQNYSAKAARYALKARFYSSLALNISTFIIYAVSIGVVVLGVHLIADRVLTVGGLIACVILSGRALAPLGNITTLLTRFYQTKCSLAALNQLMSAPLDRDPERSYIHRKTFDGKISFEQVSFKYATQTVPFFKDFSLVIKPGEKVAILGNIGSGKTTLYHMILGLYPPLTGNIKIDDIDIRQLDPVELRKQIGFISQNPKLFFGTIRDNIAIKAPTIDDENVIRAAKISGADSFIKLYPMGYATQIGEGGRGLSGGQIQAIALARAFLPEPKILLLDEPTSAMDMRLEQYVIGNMAEYFKNKTVLITTHTNQLIQLVDRIVILHQGKIAVDGSRQAVINKLRQMRAEGVGDSHEKK